jgi:IS30 family transposase
MCLSQFLLLIIFNHVMVYTSPMKVAHIVEQNRQGLPPSEIAQSIGAHHTTVTRILKRFKKLGDYYHVNPKTGHPHKMDTHESWIAAWMIAKVEAANAVEIQKNSLPQSLRQDSTEALEGTGAIMSHLEVQAQPNGCA